METVVSEKGPLLSGALRSCLARFDPSFDFGSAAHVEHSSFAAYCDDRSAYFFLGMLASADISPYVAFALKSGVSRLVLFIDVGFMKNISGVGLAQVLGALGIQGGAFDLETHIIRVVGAEMVEVAPVSSLEVCRQDDSARQAFSSFLGASDVLDVLERAGCEVLFSGDVAIGTYLGLEVARSIRTGDEVALQVGVGRNDRVARQWLGTGNHHRELVDAIETVKGFRLGASRFHPLARLSTARWMRSVVSSEPRLISMESIVMIELRRTAHWPAEGAWSLAKGSEIPSEEDLIYRGSSVSFEDDEVSFALASDATGEEHLLGFCSSASLGSSVKLFEVMASLHEHGVSVGGSILVMQEESRISAVERMVQLANFDLSIAVLPKSWKNLLPLGG